MLRTQADAILSSQHPGPASVHRAAVPSHRMACGAMLAGACLLGVAWGGTTRPSEPANQPVDSTVVGNDTSSLVGSLVRQLDDPRPAARREAIVRLAGLGPAAAPAVSHLMKHLRDRDLLVRAHAARASCRLGLAPEPVVPTLADLLRSPKPQVCCLTALILGDLGPAAHEALPPLRMCLAAPAAIVRLHAAEAILKIDHDDAEALNELVTALNGDESDLRYFAANALGSAGIENEDSYAALGRALTDSDTNVSAAAGLNLSRLDDRARSGRDSSGAATDDRPPSVEVAQLMADLSHSSAAVRQEAAIRLAATGPSADCAAEALHARLDDPNLVVRVHAAHALWGIERRADEVLPVLLDLLDVESPNVSTAAAFVLGQMQSAAAPALPAMRDLLAASELLDRLFLAGMISLIDPNEREAQAILIDGLHDPEGDVRYLSAVALGDAPLAHQRRVTRELADAQSDRNMRVQSAAGAALQLLQARAVEERREMADRRRLPSGAPVAAATAAVPAEQVDVLSGPLAAARKAAMEARLAAQTATQAAAEARAHRRAAVVSARRIADERLQELPPADDEQAGHNEIPPMEGDAIARAGAQIDQQSVSDEDPEEGLKPIREVRATIRMQPGPFPDDLAAPRFASLPVVYHGYGARRGWSTSCFGWEAPAVFFKPLYFEDINLERYGMHFGCLQPVVSFGSFFGRCAFLPYSLLVQPPCECIYTLGYERPNNCIPLFCCSLGCPSYGKWCQKCPCPVRAPCPWEHSENSVCTDEDDCP